METIKEKVLIRINGRYVGNLFKAPNVYWIKMGIDETLNHVLKLIDEAPIHWASKKWIKQKIQG